ncbi:MAG: GTP 3',8-cyclase MoaA [Bacteroidetes bacterium]|nr:GTP 3',8-cyclase MoaA [Bacteroidota bacterium]MBS1541260.1 GTP 3',8-cyclase MoaA [Bacteroidota bacterium]
MLTDLFGRVHDYLRISITDKCNLRCSYCMPYDLPHGYYANIKRMTADEIYSIAKTFVGFGIKKIRITGGEPLMRKEFRKIIQLLAQLPVELALSSNGVLIDDFMEDLQQAKIKSVNISLDSLQAETFSSITKRNEQERVLSNIHLLLKNNFEVKINTVVMRGINEQEIVNFVSLTKDLALHIRFIEYMPFLGNGWHKNQVFTYDEILSTIGSVFSYTKLNDPVHSTSKNFKVNGYAGTFGIITTMSRPFCGDCNRLRLTADGKMKNCLFDKEEIDLLSSLRNNDDITELVLKSVRNKKAAMGGQFDNGYQQTEANQVINRSMVGIGG